MQGRYSFIGAQPALEVLAQEGIVTVLDHETQQRSVSQQADPLETVIGISRKWKPVPIEGLPRVFTGGWSGYCGYDTVRYVYGGNCSAASALSCCMGILNDCEPSSHWTWLIPAKSIMVL